MLILRTFGQARRAIRSLYRGIMLYWFGRPSLRDVHGWRLTFRLRILLVLGSNESLRNLTPSREVRLWADQEAFPRIFELIADAEHAIVIQMFIWKDDGIGRRMGMVLLEAADRGVRVDITKEAIGDVFEFHRDFLTTQKQSEPLWQRFWTHPLIRIHYAPYNDHGKAFIIDGRILLITGMNIADVYHYQLHDYLVELRGTRFVEKYLTQGELQDGEGRVRLRLNSARVKEIRPTVMRMLREARESIVIEHCYVSDPEVIDLLIQRSHEGVRVTCITPEKTELLHNFSNQDTVNELLKRGSRTHLKVFLYPAIFHAKVLLTDREHAFIGSANLMASSLDEMGEVNVELHGGHQWAIMKLREILRNDVLLSTLVITPSRYQWFVRWMAWLKL